MTERERDIVDPLQVVDEDERRADRAQRTMCAFENTDRLQR